MAKDCFDDIFDEDGELVRRKKVKPVRAVKKKVVKKKRKRRIEEEESVVRRKKKKRVELESKPRRKKGVVRTKKRVKKKNASKAASRAGIVGFDEQTFNRLLRMSDKERIHVAPDGRRFRVIIPDIVALQREKRKGMSSVQHTPLAVSGATPPKLIGYEAQGSSAYQRQVTNSQVAADIDAELEGLDLRVSDVRRARRRS